MIDYFRRKRFHHYNTPGHAHELTFWCLRHARLFDDALACDLFLQELSRARVAYRFKLYAYVVMPTHVHLVIGPSERKYDIIRIRKGVMGGFARRYRAALHGTDGGFTVWEPGGGEDRNLWDAESVRDSIHYIEANPVRSFLADGPEAWQASSAHARRRRVGVIPDPFGHEPRRSLQDVDIDIPQDPGRAAVQAENVIDRVGDRYDQLVASGFTEARDIGFDRLP